MLDHAFLILTAFAAQLTYRWLQPPRRSSASSVQFVDPANFLALDWPQLLAEARRAGPEVHPWLEAYLRRDSGGEQLLTAIRRNLQSLSRAGGYLITMADGCYPLRLRHLAEPPLVLSCLGDPQGLIRPAVAIVGSRKASVYALRQSYDLGRSLANVGVAVVSGGAFGCDIAAHRGVLAAQGGGHGVCVFAGGLSSLYPAANRDSFQRLRRAGGALISERLWDAPCRKLDFHHRNRIIAGWCPLTVVMQAAVRSGAMLTARLALDGGADVMVLPHPADDERALGSHALLTDGASPLPPLGELLTSFLPPQISL